MGTGIFFKLEDFAVALMHDCRVNIILVKFKSLIIVLFNFRKARHSISTVFPEILRRTCMLTVAGEVGRLTVCEDPCNTWCLGI